MSTGSAFLDWINQTFFHITPEQEEAWHHQAMVDFGAEPMTPAEQRQADVEDRAAYIKGILTQGGRMQNTWIDSDGLIHYEDYVILQNGNRAVIETGTKGYALSFDERTPSPVNRPGETYREYLQRIIDDGETARVLEEKYVPMIVRQSPGYKKR